MSTSTARSAGPAGRAAGARRDGQPRDQHDHLEARPARCRCGGTDGHHNHSSGAQAEDPHPGWWAEYQRLDAEGLGFADGDAFDELLDEQNDLLMEIATTPAATVAGALAQVRVVRLGIEMGEAAWDEDALGNAIATLERLAGL